MFQSFTHGPAITSNGVLAAGSPLHDNCIIDWELHQKVMAKKRTIKICTGIGLNMFFPEYITIELQDIDTKIRKNTIITDWLEEHGDLEIDIKVKKQLRKSKKNG